MKRLQILAMFFCSVLVVDVSAGERRTALAIAPAIVKGGDLTSDLLQPMQEAIAEMLSWEASMVPTIRVIDPVPLQTALEKGNWSSRTDLAEPEVEDARTASRQLDADAVVLTRFVHQGRSVEWQVALGYRRETQDLSYKLSGRSREDEFVQKIREQALVMMDTLGVKVAPAAKQMVATRGKVSWEALVEYASGIRDQKALRNEDAFRHFQEASRKAPFLPSLQVRQKKLEMELQSTR